MGSEQSGVAMAAEGGAGLDDEMEKLRSELAELKAENVELKEKAEAKVFEKAFEGKAEEEEEEELDFSAIKSPEGSWGKGGASAEGDEDEDFSAFKSPDKTWGNEEEDFSSCKSPKHAWAVKKKDCLRQVFFRGGQRMGMIVDSQSGHVEVENVEADSQAARQGVKGGDILIYIEGVSARGKSVRDVGRYIVAVGQMKECIECIFWRGDSIDHHLPPLDGNGEYDLH